MTAKENQTFTSPSKEQLRPLTVTLSERAQGGVLDCLMEGLQKFTKQEVQGHFDSTPPLIEELDAVRKLTITIRKHVGARKLSPWEALRMGLTDLITPRELEAMANMQVRDKKHDISVIENARYFLEKAQKP